MKTIRWDSRDLELLPDDGNRYEIVDRTLDETNTLQSPLLPGFSCTVSQLFTTALP